jgi:hypothetical protein
VNARQWQLARRAVDEVSTAGALTDRMLAERLDVTVTELRPVIGMLLGRGKLERCVGYLVIVPQAPGAVA